MTEYQEIFEGVCDTACRCYGLENPTTIKIFEIVESDLTDMEKMEKIHTTLAEATE